MKKYGDEMKTSTPPQSLLITQPVASSSSVLLFFLSLGALNYHYEWSVSSSSWEAGGCKGENSDDYGISLCWCTLAKVRTVTVH